jgi:hypothetical protein
LEGFCSTIELHPRRAELTENVAEFNVLVVAETGRQIWDGTRTSAQNKPVNMSGTYSIITV